MIARLLKVGHSEQKIFSLLRPLNMTQLFIECIKPCYEETGNVVDHARRGWPHSTRTKNVVEAGQFRINQNSHCKQKILTV